MMALTQKRLKELLHYNPLTGDFTWIVDRGVNREGDTLNSLRINHSGKKYIRVGLDGKRYDSHRLAFLYITGEFPPDQVDHIDGDGTNNKWSNLRNADNTCNSQNSRKYVTNKSGFTGVWWRKDRERWVVEIKVSRRKISLGSFDCKIDAIEARMMANKKYGFHKNHGESRPL